MTRAASQICSALPMQRFGARDERGVMGAPKLLPGRYKGTRKRRPAPVLVVPECFACGEKFQPVSPKRAEVILTGHVARAHQGFGR